MAPGISWPSLMTPAEMHKERSPACSRTAIEYHRGISVRLACASENAWRCISCHASLDNHEIVSIARVGASARVIVLHMRRPVMARGQREHARAPAMPALREIVVTTERRQRDIHRAQRYAYRSGSILCLGDNHCGLRVPNSMACDQPSMSCAHGARFACGSSFIICAAVKR